MGGLECQCAHDGCVLGTMRLGSCAVDMVKTWVPTALHLCSPLQCKLSGVKRFFEAFLLQCTEVANPHISHLLGYLRIHIIPHSMPGRYKVCMPACTPVLALLNSL